MLQKLQMFDFHIKKLYIDKVNETTTQIIEPLKLSLLM